ncbi:hypothetical protein BGX20_003407 [Mortierella sp. AD010]|nr:hypothetical protein BGX20_003407 [Mortierella sp. AD010]
MPHLRGSIANFADYVEKHNENRVHLDKFYNGKKYTFKKHKNMVKTRQEKFYKLTDSLLRMVGGFIDDKKEEDIVVIGIDMGQFTSSSRLARWGILSLVYTNITPTKNAPPVGQTDNIRHLYCSNCHKYMHRDIMAGHNIVSILKNHVENLERLLYLRPVDKDGKHPWIERGGASTAGVKDAPKSVATGQRQ